MDEQDPICLNGIHGVTGEYLVEPLSWKEAARIALGKPQHEGLRGWFGRIAETVKTRFLGLPLDVDPTDIARAGWAIVFPENGDDAVRQALQPLIDHRRTRVPPMHCKELDYRAGERMKDWLKRHQVGPGNITPTKVPYYVLLVGEPTEIPFEFQYLLDIEYAVGRIAFDHPDDYRQYAQSLIDYEISGRAAAAEEVVYWGPRHTADRATQMSADHLIAPLFQGLPAADKQPALPAIAEELGYRSRCFVKQDGKKANLQEVLHGENGKAPTFLLTASHGMAWPQNDQRHYEAQGALLCQDWGGFGEVKSSDYLAADSVEEDARLHGLVAFMFACYGAGTPQFDPYLKNRSQGPSEIARRPFVAPLPKRLLAHPQGAALAVLGHVERAWGYSIKPPGVGAQLTPFRNFVGRVLQGEPVGHATADISQKYAIVSAHLLSLLDEAKEGQPPSDRELAAAWIERNDAQNYIVLGDPAARIRVDHLE